MNNCSNFHNPFAERVEVFQFGRSLTGISKRSLVEAV